MILSRRLLSAPSLSHISVAKSFFFCLSSGVTVVGGVTGQGEHNFERWGKHAVGFVAVVVKRKLMFKIPAFFRSLCVFAL